MNISLGVSVMMFPEEFNRAGKTLPEYEQHHSTVRIGLKSAVGYQFSFLSFFRIKFIHLFYI